MPRGGRVLRALGAYGLFTLATAGLWVVGGHVLGSWRLRQEGRAWAAAGRSMEDLVRRFSPRGDSPQAVELNGLTRELGIRLVRDPVQAPIDDQTMYLVFKSHLGKIADATTPDGYTGPPALHAYLGEHRVGLTAVASLLARSDAIAWETNLDAGLGAPIPSLIAHMFLNTLLMCEAVERQRRHDPAGAELMLVAAWAQTRTLATRADLISQLIAIALVNQQTSILRRLPEASAEWPSRLGQVQFREGILRGFQAEAYSYLPLPREYRAVADLEASNLEGVVAASPVSGVLRILSIPYVRVSIANHSSHMRRVVSLAESDRACARSGAELAEEVESEIARGDVVSKAAVPGLLRAWIAATKADLAIEATRIALDARGRIATPTAPVSSAVCEGLHWQLRREPSGGLAVVADPPDGLTPELLPERVFVVAGPVGGRFPPTGK